MLSSMQGATIILLTGFRMQLMADCGRSDRQNTCYRGFTMRKYDHKSKI